MVARTPPTAVLTKLRREVGFRCPVKDCGNPYLTWHHFDPPWRVEHHHRPEGMIALCRQHADKADHGSFTDDQLRQLKESPYSNPEQGASGRFDWMRRDIMAFIGSNFYRQCPVLLHVGGFPVVWFNRDEDGYLLLNLIVPSLTGKGTALIRDNVWYVAPGVDELICPPSGRLIDVKLGGGDMFKCAFFLIPDAKRLYARYPMFRGDVDRISFPLTVVEVTLRVQGTGIEFGPSGTSLAGNYLSGCYFDTVPGGAIDLQSFNSNAAALFSWAISEADEESESEERIAE